MVDQSDQLPVSRQPLPWDYFRIAHHPETTAEAREKYMRNARLLSPSKSRRFNGQRSSHKALPVQDHAHRGHAVLSHRPRGHNPFTVGHESDGIQSLRNAEEFLGSRELWLAAVGAGFHRINLVSLAVVQLFAVGGPIGHAYIVV